MNSVADNTNTNTNPHYVASTDRIAIIGAGVAGIAMAAALQHAGYTNFVVYEKQPNLGGLWRQNYPNVAGTCVCECMDYVCSY
jgi:cation diffusion facilitator CzcD-associated flavoprotein CzcO